MDKINHPSQRKVCILLVTWRNWAEYVPPTVFTESLGFSVTCLMIHVIMLKTAHQIKLDKN